MILESCENRQVIKISGSDRESFLSGLITNDISNGLTYSALLTPQGKYLSDFFLIRCDDDILIDIDESLSEAFVSRLLMYKLRADVSISAIDLPVSIGQGAIPDGAFEDPRHPSLGWRLYSVEGGVPITDWNQLYVDACIPRSGVELLPNETYILEAGFEKLSGVDFKKGCFVGQEVTARMKHKTKLKKGFLTVNIRGTAPIGTEIISNERICGTLFSQGGGRAIAYLRYDKMSKSMKASNAILTLID
jgi:hypothetical protein